MKKFVSKKFLRKWLGRIITLGIVAAGVAIFQLYLDSFDPYDYSHLTPVMNFGDAVEFTPLEGSIIPDMVRAAENDNLALYVDTETTFIAVYDKRNGHIWRSTPEGTNNDMIANPHERNTMNSAVGIWFYDERRRQHFRWSFNDSVAHEQAEIYSIPNGVAFRYVMGSVDLGIYALPRYMEIDRFETRVLDQVPSDDDRRWLRRNWIETSAMPGFVRMMDGARQAGNALRMIRIFEEIGYDIYELEYDNEAAGYESDVSFDIVTLYIEFVLDGDSLVVNLPLDRIELSGDEHLINSINIMRFFGAGGMDEEGYILVPSGSGGIIEFNNGRHTEERYFGIVYGLDYIMHTTRPQLIQPVRLPLFGINKGGAAMVAHVENGAALATINADVAGRLNSYNHAFFSFSIRSSQLLDIGLTGLHHHTVRNLNVIQSSAYTGDITIRYHFLAANEAGEDVSLGDMAAAYQQFLVDNGALTPLEGSSDRPFFLDIVGAADVQRHFLGTPYMGLEVMTTFQETNHILDILNNGDVRNIQMMLHGWFNRGINHDVAKDVSLIRGLGTVPEMIELNNRLSLDGGALNPVVNFMLTNFHSRNFNNTFEAARDVGGFIGVKSSLSRDTLFTRFTHHANDWFYLVSPVVLPFHVSDFIESYSSNIGIGNVALADLGDILIESLYRRNPVDREHARLIASDQMRRLANEFNNVVVFGGNDYSLRHASHLVDVPVRTDWFYIINHEVPFYQMVMHGFVEFAGHSVNLQPNPNARRDLLNSIATGAAPRFTMTAQPTRLFQFSPHERLYSTHYVNWVEQAIEQYHVFNNIHRYLRDKRIVDFIILADGSMDQDGMSKVTVTVFEDGTRIYVNNTRRPFETDYGVVIEPMWFVVR